MDVTNPPFSASVTFASTSHDLFGTPVNLGASPGSLAGLGTLTLAPGFVGGTFTMSLAAPTPADLTANAAGDFICTVPLCTAGPVSFVGGVSNLAGTVPAGFPPGLIYVFDGSLTFLGIISGYRHFEGQMAINAFQPAATPTSPLGCVGPACAVTVDVPSTTVVNSMTGEQVTVDPVVTFAQITQAGTTTVTAVSNVAGETQANFAFNANATYLDVSTTAQYAGGPIEVCVNYTIAGDVGDPSALHLMHLEGGVWQDVTSSLQIASQTICGTVSTLSPFGVAVGPAAIPSLSLHGALLLGALLMLAMGGMCRKSLAAV